MLRIIVSSRPLSQGGLELHSAWTFDVPERFTEPLQLYVWLSWGHAPDKVPSWAEVEPAINEIFQKHGQAGGIVLRFRRLLWQACVP